MQVAIPPAFESFAREQIAAGHVGSEEEAVARVLRDYLDEVRVLRELVDPAIAAADRGDTADGETFMQELLAETKAMVGSTERS